MDITSKVIMLILMQSVLKEATTGCTFTGDTRTFVFFHCKKQNKITCRQMLKMFVFIHSVCPYRYAKLQTISPNQSVTFNLHNSSEHINKTLRWCISGSPVESSKNRHIFTVTEMNNLIYNNPYPGDDADGMTLYLVDLVDGCTHPLRAISINSLDINFTEPQYHILLHVDKGTPVLTYTIISVLVIIFIYSLKYHHRQQSPCKASATQAPSPQQRVCYSINKFNAHNKQTHLHIISRRNQVYPDKHTTS